MRILTETIIHPLRYRLFAFDLDGTLRGCTVQNRPPNTLDEQTVLPNVSRVIDRYQWGTEHFFGIVSNQGGVGLGYINRTVLHDMIDELCSIVWERHVQSDAHYTDFGQVMICPHAPNDMCPCRKPSPYLLLHLMLSMQATLKLALPFRVPDVLFIGDQHSDYQCAERANIDFCWSRDFFGWE